MKNHFLLSYSGNKRNEVKFIYERCNFDGITTIIEPFCGSCAMSFYISTLRPSNPLLNDTILQQLLIDLHI